MASTPTPTPGSWAERAVTASAFLAATATMAFIGSRYMPGAWYAGLVKPSWTPPNWLFGPVWSLLYLMIAIAGASAWRARPWSTTVWIWGAQLVLNGTWSWLFFGLQRPDLALIDIALLWLAIVAFIWHVRDTSRAAALLFVPYGLWVSFAAALNFAIWRLNP